MMRIGVRTGRGLWFKVYMVCENCPEHELVPLRRDPDRPPCGCKWCSDRRAVGYPWF